MAASMEGRLNFIDWMKAVGMFLIVAGHVIGDPYSAFNQIAQPAYTKQLGVAFFVFITGWGLANSKNVSLYTLYSRLYLLFAYGLIFALLFMIVGFAFGPSLQLSNFLPLMFGANVFFDNFPANPTTWYIGTYLHLLLVWFFWLRHNPVTYKTLILGFIIENAVRTALLFSGNIYIAYMLFPSWISIFLLGHYLSQKKDNLSLQRALAVFLVWLVVAIGWSELMQHIVVGREIPFRHLLGREVWTLPLQSLFISFIYIVSTLLFFHFARSLPASKLVQFFSRNTVVLFIIHVPIIFAFYPTFYAWIDGVEQIYKQIALILIIYIGCAFVSEFLNQRLNLERWKMPLWRELEKRFL
ncbi:acyltransferase family protein [Alteromonas sp. 345S023]|uniref:Acyltransferase family protein n=1 Tax=Alteromonas profundi TaxID=2696062 RepID=A0A7X5LMF7_9ALTE|nr:acyltransferase [Alteromonas profundi]NDV91345.1 acyltransferase family protein [Alteromonas profundi]